MESELDPLRLVELERLRLGVIEGVEVPLRLSVGVCEDDREIDGVMVGVAESEGLIDMVGVIEGLAVGVLDRLRVGVFVGVIEVEAP